MASQAYDKALQLDRSNQGAQGKLNLIKDLFSQGTTTRGQQSKVAVAKVEPPPVPSAQPVPPPAKPAATAPAAPVAKAPAASAAPETPAAKAPPAAPAVQKVAPANNPDEVLRAVNGWAQAWETNDVAGYLGYYAPDFQTPRGMSRKAWEAERKARIAKPRKIEVEIDSPQVRFEDKNRAVVTFRQHYKSGSLDVTSNKTLVMIKNGDKWLIQQERT
jgi:ketosteroid isomerase-like protein